jgi:hypothetical protein
MQEYIEDLEDEKMILERLKNDTWKRYSMEEVAKECGIDLNTI